MTLSTRATKKNIFTFSGKTDNNKKKNLPFIFAKLPWAPLY